MKISKILLFIVAILAGLAAICVVVPEEGIQVGGVTLEFPSLLQVLNSEEREEDEGVAEKLNPEELIEKRMVSLQTQKTDEFHQFAETSPQRIYMPGDDEAYLDPFFQSLEQAGSEHVRILHLGDSQLECDRISSSLREHYQMEFGGHGVGLVPALQTVATYTLSQSISPSGNVGHYLVYGPADARASHRRYGVMGQVNRVHSGTTIRLSARDPEKHPCSGGVRRVTVMACGSGGMTLRTGSENVPFEATEVNEAYTRFTATLPKGENTLNISVNGDYDIYGIMLDDEKGVSLDNVPMRGCSGTIFTQIDEHSMAPFFQQENVKLIILQYGGNSVPGCTSAKSISGYMKTLRRQIALFRRMAPSARILFIGPADMATRMHGEMKTYPCMEQMVDSLREMSLQEGVAFWDMFSAMGGAGSIVKWYRAKPQLAGADFVHFTPKGAQKMADMLYGTLQLYYRFYRLRMGKENESDMRDLQFQDAVAPVEGSSYISVSELPRVSHDSLSEDGVEEYPEDGVTDPQKEAAGESAPRENDLPPTHENAEAATTSEQQMEGEQ